VYRLLAEAEQALARKINPTLYTSQEFHRRLSAENPFLKRVLAGETIVLMGVLPDE
ncbi:MAG: transcriptional regulator, partial [bacterium]|nr:transcriptional regulator [bacterium]